MGEIIDMLLALGEEPPQVVVRLVALRVALQRALDAAHIPYFVSEFEESMSSFDHLEIQLETFVENLMFD